MSRNLKNITTNESVLIAVAGRGADMDMYEATVTLAGEFDSGTLTVQLSPDNGVTKVTLRDVAGSIVSVADDDVYNIRVGYAGKNGEELEIYATMAGGGGSVDVDVYTHDNK